MAGARNVASTQHEFLNFAGFGQRSFIDPGPYGGCLFEETISPRQRADLGLKQSKALASTTIFRLGSLLASGNNSTFELITAFASRRIAEGCTVALLTTGALRE